MEEDLVSTTSLQRAFARCVRGLREKQGISQEALALKAGINRSHMHKLEAGQTNPTLLTMLRLCRVLGISFTRFARELEKQLMG